MTPDSILEKVASLVASHLFSHLIIKRCILENHLIIMIIMINIFMFHKFSEMFLMTPISHCLIKNALICRISITEIGT